MKFAILIHGAPYSHQASRSGYLFTRAALEMGHEIYRVFFYHDGVYNANQSSVAPQDEADIQNEWADLGKEHQLDMVLCISSSLRRGMLDATEAERYEKPGFNVSPQFTVSGLGQLIDASINADRLITFGA